MKKIAVIGGGGWGTALAILLAENKCSVSVWEYDEAQVKAVTSSRKNEKYLPGVSINESIVFSSDLPEVLQGKDFILIVVPSHIYRSVCMSIRESGTFPGKIVTATKGIENKTLMRMSQIAQEILEPDSIAVLSGPSHAEEVARGIPTAVVTGSENLDFSKYVQRLFTNSKFRVYHSADIAGIELGGALKNVIAIAAGICDGAGFGDNTKAALITRGIVEITRIGLAMNAKKETFSGLSGLGDLIVTCASRHSRNRYVGEQIGRGKKLQDVLAKMDMVAEGVKTTNSAHELVKKINVEAPIINEIYKVLFQDKDPLKAMNELMTRELKAESII